MKKWLFFCFLIACFTMIGCQKEVDYVYPTVVNPTSPVIFEENEIVDPPQEQVEPIIEEDIDNPVVNEEEGDEPQQIAQIIMELLANGLLTEVASYVSPDGSVRFSPYPYVLEDVDFQLTAEELANAMNDPSIVTTREYDGSGEPMNLTFNQYYDQFINDHPYATEASVGVNTTNGLGAMIQNWQDVYPEDQYVSIEYYMEGTAEYEGMDWSSLRIVLQKSDTQYELVAIIHGSRTI